MDEHKPSKLISPCVLKSSKL